MKTSLLRSWHLPDIHSRSVNVALWATQCILAVVFVLAGAYKCFQPLDVLQLSMPWVADVPGTLVRYIGTVELLGAIGLLLPSLTRIAPQLTPMAAVGLTLDMGLATLFHLTRGELSMAPVPLFLGLLAAFVAWGRITASPIHPSA